MIKLSFYFFGFNLFTGEIANKVAKITKFKKNQKNKVHKAHRGGSVCAEVRDFLRDR